ncbi:hypothetical protein DSCA_31500 [Desulfosarcina alkanivorans]|jgi:hypothetical protein|uniref:Uncharacterized protein n=2 Tax=Desulfosarcina alkanivorans TaxID=571177 RepID=A0A5K7YLV8_9BACT|nr:hypothetical protein DSCA_31500 [Desulfosarcina alkanivorans]
MHRPVKTPAGHCGRTFSGCIIDGNNSRDNQLHSEKMVEADIFFEKQVQRNDDKKGKGNGDPQKMDGRAKSRVSDEFLKKTGASCNG